MKTTHDIMRNRLLSQAGLGDDRDINIASLEETEWCPKFERLMRNRLIMGAFRYVTFAERKAQGARYDAIGSAIARLKNYQRTGNQEHLVDASNLCMIEFHGPTHPQAHWAPEDDGDHVAAL